MFNQVFAFGQNPTSGFWVTSQKFTKNNKINGQGSTHRFLSGKLQSYLFNPINSFLLPSFLPNLPLIPALPFLSLSFSNLPRSVPPSSSYTSFSLFFLLCSLSPPLLPLKATTGKVQWCQCPVSLCLCVHVCVFSSVLSPRKEMIKKVLL